MISNEASPAVYGRHVSRGSSLLEKRNGGKNRTKTIGRVDIPQKAFMTVLEPEE